MVGSGLMGSPSHGIESLESGLASPEDIDAAMRLGCAHPMGPRALCDLIGLDVVLALARTRRAELDDPFALTAPGGSR